MRRGEKREKVNPRQAINQRAFRTNHSSTISLSSRTGVFARFCFIATHARSLARSLASVIERDARTSSSLCGFFPKRSRRRTHRSNRNFSPLPDARRATTRNARNVPSAPRRRLCRFGSSRVPRLFFSRVRVCGCRLNLERLLAEEKRDPLGVFSVHERSNRSKKKSDRDAESVKSRRTGERCLPRRRRERSRAPPFGSVDDRW